MKVERLDPDTLASSDGDVLRFIESDFKIRRGLCPNNCGLLQDCVFGQECAACGFLTNQLREEGQAQ